MRRLSVQEFLNIPAPIAEFAIVVITSAITGGLMLFAYSNRASQTGKSPHSLIRQADRTPVFLFDNEKLTDATPSAHELLRAAPSADSSWQRLSALLSPRFPTLVDDLADLGSNGETFVAAMAPGDSGIIHAEWWGGLVRIELGDSERPEGDVRIDGQCLRASENELSLLRHISEESPVLAWQFDQSGTLIWANAAYMDVAASRSGRARSNLWPPQNILPELKDKPADGSEHRLTLHPEETRRLDVGQKPRWFDCRKSTWKGTTVCVALESRAEVNARAALDEFVQTLSKTFAHLSVGLAVFDKARQLVLFNPALTDLTGLDVMFLSQKPELSSFLDELRSKRMIPEPKNYASWRDHIRRLEVSATNGTYEESWPLPSGRTYKMTGRPHPNGAIAFQIEDITPEITLTRQFRAELELSQAVIDTLPDAIVVFSPSGTLTISNQAYATLWRSDPRESITEITYTDAISLWAKVTEASPIWSGVESSICRIHNREPWGAETKMDDGRHLFITITPIAGGATMIRFTASGTSNTAAPIIWKSTRKRSEPV